MQNVIAINAAARQSIIAAQATSDDMLLQSIAGGDRTAMHILYSRHNVRVYRFILRIVRDTTMETDLRLDRRPAQMAIEDRLGRLQTHSLVTAVQQLAQSLHRARRQLPAA